MPGQVEAAAADAVDLDHAPHPLPFSVQRDRHLETAPGGLHLGVDPGGRGDRPEQLQIAPRARRRGQREHRDRLEQVGLALPVRTDEDVHAMSRHQVEMGVVAVVVEL